MINIFETLVKNEKSWEGVIAICYCIRNLVVYNNRSLLFCINCFWGSEIWEQLSWWFWLKVSHKTAMKLHCLNLDCGWRIPFQGGSLPWLLSGVLTSLLPVGCIPKGFCLFVFFHVIIFKGVQMKERKPEVEAQKSQAFIP